MTAISDRLKELNEQLSQELEDNRIESERLKKVQDENKEEIQRVSHLINQINNNKEERERIEKDLDKIYFQIQQLNLS